MLPKYLWSDNFEWSITAQPRTSPERDIFRRMNLESDGGYNTLSVSLSLTPTREYLLRHCSQIVSAHCPNSETLSEHTKLFDTGMRAWASLIPSVPRPLPRRSSSANPNPGRCRKYSRLARKLEVEMMRPNNATGNNVQPIADKSFACPVCRPPMPRA
jgi:hypothetical protein